MEKPKIRNNIKPAKSRGSRNRTAGHNYERLIAKEFREILGDSRCRTSRQSSTLLDSCKVDLDSYFVNVQTKNVKSTINYYDLINLIKSSLQEDMPERAEYPVIVLHKRSGKEVAVMRKEDLYSILIGYKRYIDENRRRS